MYLNIKIYVYTSFIVTSVRNWKICMYFCINIIQFVSIINGYSSKSKKKIDSTFLKINTNRYITQKKFKCRYYVILKSSTLFWYNINYCNVAFTPLSPIHTSTTRHIKIL